MIVSSQGNLAIDADGHLVRFGVVRNRRGLYPARLGHMNDQLIAWAVPTHLEPEFRELLDLWHDGPTFEEYRDEVRQTFYRGLI